LENYLQWEYFNHQNIWQWKILLYHGSWIKSKTSLKKIKPPLLAQLKLSEMELSNLPQIIRLQSKQNMKKSKRIRKIKSRQRNKTKSEGKIEELLEKKEPRMKNLKNIVINLNEASSSRVKLERSLRRIFMMFMETTLKKVILVHLEDMSCNSSMSLKKLQTDTLRDLKIICRRRSKRKLTRTTLQDQTI